MEQQPQKITSQIDEEIDFIALAKKLWFSRNTIIKTVIYFTCLGIAIAFLTPKQYTATSTIVPQLGGDGNSKIGGLGGLAALAGINLDMTQQNGLDLSPIVYPQIVSSIPFQLELMNTPLNFEDFNQPITLFDYLIKLKKPTIIGIIKKYTIGLPGVISNALKGEKKNTLSTTNLGLKPLTLTEDQVQVQKMLFELVKLNVNTKDGYLTITVKLSEPLATAQMALKAQNLLQKYIIEFKIQKSQANLEFIESSYLKAKNEFEQAQVKLAIATDRSQGFVSGLPKVEIDRLQSQYTISFGVYQELAKQFEQAKIQVKKETPVFTVLDPPVVPSQKTKPQRGIILIIWTFLGIVAGIGLVFGKDYLANFKENWEKA